MMETVRSSVAL